MTMGIKGMVMGIVVFILSLFLINIRGNIFPGMAAANLDLFAIGLLIAGIGSLVLGLMARE